MTTTFGPNVNSVTAPARRIAGGDSDSTSGPGCGMILVSAKMNHAGLCVSDACLISQIVCDTKPPVAGGKPAFILADEQALATWGFVFMGKTKDGMRPCKMCGGIFPATTEYFYVTRTTFQPYCKKCSNQRAIDYKKKRGVEGIEREKETSKRYRETHREEARQWYSKWAQKHKEYRQEYWRRRYIDRPEDMRISSAEQRARRKSILADFTQQDWQNALTFFNGCCAYCGNPPSLFDRYTVLHQEHYIPTIKGGTYTPDNILPACQSCNLSKSDIDVEKWLEIKFGKKQAKQKLNKIQQYFQSVRKHA